MRTRKPISTISYNSDAFLAQKLRELTKNKIIEFWVFIRHLPEEDEKKDHVHLFMKPAKQVQTVDLKEEFNELDPEHPEKPFTIMNIESSKFADWYLYSKHDKSYLASKGQTRKYHYRHEDFIPSDQDEFDFMVKEIDLLDITPVAGMEEAIKHGSTFSDYARSGRVPVAQISQYKQMWELLAVDSRTWRNGRANHEEPPVIDPITGEVQSASSDYLNFDIQHINDAEAVEKARNELYENKN